MVGLNPILKCLLEIEDGVSRGEAVRDVMLAWLEFEGANTSDRTSVLHMDPRFHAEILDFLRQTESSELDFTSSGSESRLMKSHFRQSFFALLKAGVYGHAILPRLRELRFEIETQLELDMKAHVESLPLKMLLPLLLFMFPAFLILLLGPITLNFMEALR